MKTFRLEIRVYDNNTRRWELFLEKLSPNHSAHPWLPPSEGRPYYLKIWDQYTIQDESLEVYLACTGYGGSARAIVLVGNAAPSEHNTLYSNFNDTRPAFITLNIN
jgi:hypothetical protein